MLGNNYLIRGLKMLALAGIRQWVIIPLLINLLVFSLLIWLAANQFSEWVNGLLNALPQWLHWLSWLIWPLFIVSALLLGYFLFSLLANIIAAPFNTYLSAAVEKHLGGVGGGTSTAESPLKALIPAVTNELKKAAYFIAWSLPLLILFLIPVVNLIAPVLWFAYIAWILALEYLDYPFGNHQVEFKEVRRRLQGDRLAALRLGASINLAMMLPLINFLVMPAAVAAATLFWFERLRASPEV